MDEETRVALLEVKASVAEGRTFNAEQFALTAGRLVRLEERLDTLIDSLAETNAFLHSHWHENGD